jgi:hypothetical protein
VDEAILIEMAQRFRALEDIAEFAGALLPRDMPRDEFVNFTSEGMSEALEACRDDMVAMQEAIRARAGK